MSRLDTRVLAILVGALLAVSGCTSGPDDEMTQPTRTVTASPAPQTTAVPGSVPTGHGSVSSSDIVWAQDNTLHVDARPVDLAPLSIEAFVVVEGGVFFVDKGELWFTDLSRVRGTGITGVTRLSATTNGSAITVETSTAAGARSVHAYSMADGSSVPPAQAPPATVEDRLGRATQVVLRPERSDVTPATPAAPGPARLGPGPYGVLGGDGEPLVAFDAATRERIPLKGVVGNGFELVRWTTGYTFYGLARDNGKPLAALGCNLRTGACTTWGKVVAGRSLVFESGS
jgi:hypothetical protein